MGVEIITRVSYASNKEDVEKLKKYLIDINFDETIDYKTEDGEKTFAQLWTYGVDYDLYDYVNDAYIYNDDALYGEDDLMTFTFIGNMGRAGDPKNKTGITPYMNQLIKKLKIDNRCLQITEICNCYENHEAFKEISEYMQKS